MARPLVPLSALVNKKQCVKNIAIFSVEVNYNLVILLTYVLKAIDHVSPPLKPCLNGNNQPID